MRVSSHRCFAGIIAGLTVTVAATLSLSAVAFAADYYVDVNNGNNNNSGTSAAPWQTFGGTGGVNSRTFASGDKIFLRRGCVWRTTFVVPSSGIYVASYGPTTDPAPVISGADVMSGWVLTGTPQTYKKTGVSIEPFVVTRGVDVASAKWLKKGSGITSLNDQEWYWDPATDTLYLRDGLGNPDATGRVVEAGQRDNAVLINAKDNVTLNRLVIEKGNLTALRVENGSDNALVENCTIQLSNSSSSQGAAGINVSYSPGFTMDSCLLTGLRGDALFVRVTSNVTIKNNQFDTVWRGGNPYGDNIQFSGKHSNESGYDPAKQRNFLIENNTLTQAGTDVGKGCLIVQGHDDGTIRGNTISYGNFGIQAESNNLLIERNTCYGQGNDPAPGTSLQNQTWAAGIRLGDPERSVSNCTYRYNVVSNAMTGISIEGAGYDWTNGQPDGTDWQRTNFKFQNNTVVNCKRQEVRLDCKINGEFRNNIAWDTSSTSYANYSVRSVSGGTWLVSNNLMGTGTSSTAYPRFVNYGGNDFHLQSGSPAINAGANIHDTSVVKDRDGNTVQYNGTVDIGAYESH